MSETPQEAFERGNAAGMIAARLADHDKHFAQINGSIERVATEMHGVLLALQRLADDAKARDATVLATASALKAAEEARRDKSEQTWTPLTRAFAAVATLATIAGVYVTIKGRP